MTLYSQGVKTLLTLVTDMEPVDNAELCDIVFKHFLKNPLDVELSNGKKCSITITVDTYQYTAVTKQEVN